MASSSESQRGRLCPGMLLIRDKTQPLTYIQNLSLGLFRSDYMVHQDHDKSEGGQTIKQVEFNTIASSFGGLSTQTSNLHK